MRKKISEPATEANVFCSNLPSLELSPAWRLGVVLHTHIVDVHPASVNQKWGKVRLAFDIVFYKDEKQENVTKEWRGPLKTLLIAWF